MSTSDSTAAALLPVLTPEGMKLLNELSETVDYSSIDPLKLATTLRADGHSPELATAVLTQLKLREKARAKLGPFVEHMLFTQDGLEQASRMSVAARHAQRFLAAEVDHVVDLGSGLGADAMAMASMDLKVTAVEMDETTTAAATINLMPFPSATVVAAEAEQWVANHPVPGGEKRGYWLDPARREISSSGAQRLFDPEAFSPPLSFVEQLADSGAPVGVKLGPGLPHASVPETAEAQWVSDEGSVVEVSLWFNQVRRENVRRAALVLSPAGAEELTAGTDFGDSPGVPVSGISGATGYLYEPDGAVIRAGLVTDLLAQEFMGGDAHDASRGRQLDDHIAYFCSDYLVETPFARAFKIREVLPYNVKHLRQWLCDHGTRRLDIKKRGIDVTPEELRRTLMAGITKKKPAQGAKIIQHVTLVLVRVGDERFAIVVEPVS